MREYLFRGKSKYNGEWAYGDLVNLHNGDKYIINNKFGACIDEKGNFINTEYPFVCKVIPETVGQYVGLKDKNGKKIFEDDVFAYRYKNLKGKEITLFYAITYDNELGYWSPFGNSDCGFYSGDIAIIGNIHDNKEFLGE